LCGNGFSLAPVVEQVYDGGVLEDLDAALDEMATVDPAALADGKTVIGLHRALARLEAIATRAAAAFDAGGEWEADGARWELRGGALARVDLRTSYTSEAIGGVRIDTPAPGELHVHLPDGHEVLDGSEELARAERLAEKLRRLGVDPDQ
jgi:hypothetical protein